MILLQKLGFLVQHEVTEHFLVAVWYTEVLCALRYWPSKNVVPINISHVRVVCVACAREMSLNKHIECM